MLRGWSRAAEGVQERRGIRDLRRICCIIGTAVSGLAGEADLGWDSGGEGGTEASRRQAGRRDTVSLALGLVLCWAGIERGLGPVSSASGVRGGHLPDGRRNRNW